MKSKLIIEGIISVVFLILLGFFMHSTKGAISKGLQENEPLIVIEDSLRALPSGNDLSMSNSERIITFK